MLETLAAAATSTPAEQGGWLGGGWTAIGAAAAVGGLVATLITNLVTTISRKRNRPEPDWHIQLRGSVHGLESSYGELSGYDLSGSISNVGDGVAHSVYVGPVKSADGGFSKHHRTGGVVPLMERGAVELVLFHVDMGEWGNATLQLEWIDPPTRLRKKRSLIFQPGDYMERPGVRYTDPNTGEVSQRYIEDIDPAPDEKSQ